MGRGKAAIGERREAKGERLDGSVVVVIAVVFGIIIAFDTWVALRE